MSKRSDKDKAPVLVASQHLESPRPALDPQSGFFSEIISQCTDSKQIHVIVFSPNFECLHKHLPTARLFNQADTLFHGVIGHLQTRFHSNSLLLRAPAQFEFSLPVDPSSRLFFEGLLLPYIESAEERILCLFWQRRKQERIHELNEEYVHLGMLVEQIPIGILKVDKNWECTYANAALTTFTGIAKDAFKGRGWTKLVSDSLLQSLISQLFEFENATTEINTIKRQGQDSRVKVLASTTKDITGQFDGATFSFADITDQHERENRIHRMANYDEVTGLYNRVAMHHQLERYIDVARQQQSHVTLLFLDLDGFKTINDLHGHASGDVVLAEIANRLKQCTRTADLVARIGGDEFVIIIPGNVERERINGIANNIHTVVNHPINVTKDDQTVVVHVSASIGITFFPNPKILLEDKSTQQIRDELLKEADMAMYSAKDAGKNQTHNFDIQHSERLTKEYNIQQAIPAAIKMHEIKFAYQPVVDMQTKRVVSLEALVRWQNPALGTIDPTELIHVAESSGKIIAFQNYMLGEVLAEFQKISSRFSFKNQGIRLNINLSPAQILDAASIDFLINNIKKAGVSPSKVTLEVVESAILVDEQSVHAHFERLKKTGFKLAMDDFGTGYSSLAYLTRFDFDIVKIDKAFINTDLTEKQVSFVEGVVNLCHSLRMKVVAEGVETQAQFDSLKHIQCDYCQGYLFSPALHEADISQWIKHYEFGYGQESE